MYQLIPNSIIPPIKERGNPLKKIARDKAIAEGKRFYSSGAPCKNGHTSLRFTHNDTCKECHRRVMKDNSHKYLLKNKYGLTQQEYDDLLSMQNSVCAICKQKETTIDRATKEIKTMSVDHCHTTNKVRGILCNNCNQGIGKFYHNSEILRAAALYCEAE